MLKNRAIKKYITVLPQLLKQRYGASDFYTKGQVEKTITFAKLSTKHIDYAYALFCSENELALDVEQKDHFHEIKKYFASTYFGGDTAFTTAAVSTAITGGMFTGFAGGGGGSGDGGDG